MASETVIPDKDEFKIGEVCEIAGVKPFVLRYWETEFPELAPGQGGRRPAHLHPGRRRSSSCASSSSCTRSASPWPAPRSGSPRRSSRGQVAEGAEA